MNIIDLLGISIGLGMDAFAVSIGVSAALTKVARRQYFRLAFHFGLFQFFMPVLGWLLGSRLVDVVGAYDHWVVFALLALIGGKMVWESSGGGEGEKGSADPTRGWSLVVLSVATSLDALAVGVSFAILNQGILFPSTVIGAVAAAMTFSGMLLGGRLGLRFGKRMEAVGGVVLVVIGFRVLLEHVQAP